LKRLIIIPVLLTLTLSGCAAIPQIPSLAIPTAAVLATAIPNGPTKTPAAAVPPTTSAPAAATSAATAAPAMQVLPAIDPEKTVSLFLEGEKAKANFALASKLFSANLIAQVKDDAGLAAILGKDSVISEYKVGFPSYSADALSASLESSVYLPQPSNIRFNLVLENNEWKIDGLTILTKSGEYPTAPEGVVLAFLASYQEAPDRMSGFLTAARRAQQPPGGSTAMLQISGNFEGMVVQSAAVNPDPPTASIIVMIQAGGKDYLRKFILSRDVAGWGIDSIESLAQ
jgi:hypothetical protein